MVSHAKYAARREREWRNAERARQREQKQAAQAEHERNCGPLERSLRVAIRNLPTAALMAAVFAFSVFATRQLADPAALHLSARPTDEEIAAATAPPVYQSDTDCSELPTDGSPVIVCEK